MGFGGSGVEGSARSHDIPFSRPPVVLDLDFTKRRNWVAGWGSSKGDRSLGKGWMKSCHTSRPRCNSDTHPTTASWLAPVQPRRRPSGVDAWGWGQRRHLLGVHPSPRARLGVHHPNHWVARRPGVADGSGSGWRSGGDVLSHHVCTLPPVLHDVRDKLLHWRTARPNPMQPEDGVGWLVCNILMLVRLLRLFLKRSTCWYESWGVLTFQIDGWVIWFVDLRFLVWF